MPGEELLQRFGVLVILSLLWTIWSAVGCCRRVGRWCRTRERAEPSPEPETVTIAPEPIPADVVLGAGNHEGCRQRGASSSQSGQHFALHTMRGPGAWRSQPQGEPLDLPNWYPGATSKGKRWYTCVSARVAPPGVYRGRNRFLETRPTRIPGSFYGTKTLEDALACYGECCPLQAACTIFL